MSIDAGTIYSSIRMKLDQHEKDIRAVFDSYDRLKTHIDKTLGDTSTKTKKRFSDINLAGVAAFTGIALAAKAAVGTFAKFDQSMANVASVARATPEDFAKLTKAAEEAGETTRFSASQAADALYYMASAGYNAEQSIAALDGVLKLAGATQSDLAFTSETVASTINQFGLAASDATRISNVFAAAIVASQATMDKLATSMAYVGPVAASMNMSLEQTVGALQVLYNSGLDASMAGTALRGALADLANAASPAQKRLRELGISYNEINPMTNSFADIIDLLNQRALTGADALKIFGDRAGPAMIQLMKAGKDEIEKYTKAVTGTNAAAEAYARQNDTLLGSVDELSSAFESLQIKFVREVAPAMRGLIDILTGIVKAIGNAPAPVKIFVAALAAGIPVALGLAAVIGAIGAIVGTIAGPILLVVAGIAALTAGISFLVGQSNQAVVLQKELAAAFEKTQKSIKDYEETQKKYVKALQDGNREEAAHLKNLLEMQKLQITANLGNLINTFKKLASEESNQNKKLKEMQDQYNRVNAEVTKRNQVIKDEIMMGRSNSLTVENLTKELKPLNKALFDSTLEIAKQKTAIQGNIDARNQMIDSLAEAYLAGQIDINQLRLADVEIAKQIILRAEQIKKIKEQTKAQEEQGKAGGGEGNAPVKDFWGDFSKSMQKASIDAGAFGDESDILKAKIDLVKKTYKELLDEGLSPGDVQMRQLMALYNALSGQLDIYNAKLETQKSAEEKLAEAKQKRAEADRDAAKTQADYAQKLSDLNQKTNDAIYAEWSHALAVVEASGASRDAINQTKNAINDYFKALTEKKATEDFKKNIESIKEIAWKFASDLLGGLGALFGALTDARLAELDRQMQAELESKGLAEASAVEKAQAELDAAILSGDAIVIQQKKNALEKVKIEEAYEKKKAQIQYKGQLAQWTTTLLQAIAEGARAIIVSATSLPWPLNLIPIAATSTITGLQIGTITASKPKPPAFAGGGVTVGSPSTEIPSILHGNEAVLNAEQMAKAFDMINNHQMGSGGGGNTGVPAVFNFEMDGSVFAKVMVNVINSGKYRINLNKGTY